MLDLVPGKRVVESGTGSASFTHALARVVHRSGRVFTFEYHAGRACTARKEFGEHGLSDVVTLTHRNVCEEGFTLDSYDGGDVNGALVGAEDKKNGDGEHNSNEKNGQDGNGCIGTNIGDEMNGTGDDNSDGMKSNARNTMKTATDNVSQIQERIPLTDIDAVFLDLPEPWKAIPHTLSFFRNDSVGRICCFSPCIEQTQRTVQALASFGFHDIEMYECLRNPIETKTIEVPHVQSVVQQQQDGGVYVEKMKVSKNPYPETKGHTAFLTFASFLPQQAVPLP